MSIGISHPAIDTTKLDICERFEFSKQAEFRKAFTGEPARNNFVLDFSKTAHIDSSALGMLLLLKEYLGGDSSRIKFVRCSPELKKIFEVCHFEKLFDID